MEQKVTNFKRVCLWQKMFVWVVGYEMARNYTFV